MNTDHRADKANERFSLVKRARSFTHAWRGIGVFMRTTHNAWIHLTLLAIAVLFGLYFGIAQSEWTALILSFGLVLSTEALNTAIEIDIDLTSPEFHPYARDTKDVAAGAVLISCIITFLVGILIFGHRFAALFWL